jgi:hypothetical protein
MTLARALPYRLDQILRVDAYTASGLHTDTSRQERGLFDRLFRFAPHGHPTFLWN